MLALALCGVCVHFLHAYQVQRNAHTFLALAELAERDGEGEEALIYLSKYIDLVPDDPAVRERFALALEEFTPPSKWYREIAITVLQQLVTQMPERYDLRRRIARISTEMGRYDDAQYHLEILLQLLPDDGELEQLLGRCAEQKHDDARAVQWYERAVRHAPRQLENYVRLANLWRQRGEAKRGDEVMDAAVTVNAESARAYLVRGLYRAEYGAAEKAAADLERARRMAPDDADVLLAWGELVLARGQVEAARADFRLGLEKSPKHVRLYLALASLETRANRQHEAADVLRHGLDKCREQPALLQKLAEILLELDRVPEAREFIKRLRKRLPVAPLPDYLEGLALYRDGRWRDSARLLEGTRPRLLANRALLKNAEVTLGHCYGLLGDTDLQVTAYRRALALDPLWVPAHVGLADAFAAVGRTEEALVEYGTVAEAWPLARIGIIRLMLLQNFRRPPVLRRWNEIERLLGEAAQHLPDAVDVPLLRAEVLSAQARLDDARNLLTAEATRKPNEVKLVVALAALANQRGGRDAAAAVLDEAQKRLGDGVELRLARARLAPGAEGLDAGLEAFLPAEQIRLLRGLAEVHANRGEHAAAEQIWRQLAQRHPDDLMSRLALFDLALDRDDDEAMQEVLGEVRRVEGETGSLWRYGEAARHLSAARRAGDKQQLQKARVWLKDVLVQRPTWAQATLLAAQLDELEEMPDQAIEHYQRTIQLGLRLPRFVRRAVQLLYERRRYLEAEQILSRVQDLSAFAGDMSRLAAEISVQTRDYERAAQLARKAVAAGSTDPRDHIWLGQILWIVGQRDEAEVALKQAVRLAEKDPDVWVALVQFLTRNGERARAETVTRDAEAKLSATGDLLALAQCYETVGLAEQAEVQYRAATAAKPNDLLTLRGVASFYLRRGQVEKSEPYFRKMIDPALRAPAVEAAWARRGLALCLADGDYQQFQTALELIEGNLRERGPSVEDLGMKANLFSRRPSNRRQAIQLYEELLGRHVLSPEEQFQLAQLYEEANQWPRARERLLALLGQEPDNPHYRVYLAHYALSLLRRGEINEVKVWLSQLESLEPYSLRTVEIQLGLCKAVGQSEDAVAIMHAYAKQPGAELDVLAGLLDNLGLGKAAEELHRTHLAQSKRPESLLQLIHYTISQKRLADALALCERAWQVCPPEQAARASVAALRADKPSDAQFRRVEEWLYAAIQKAPQSLFYLLRLAELRDLQGRYTDVEAVYRQILDKDKNNGVALNNLAWFLSQRLGQHAQALELVNRAIELHGPAAELLDTRGVIHTAAGNGPAAVRDLQEALAQKSDPAVAYRLAVVHYKARNLPAALDALRQAQAGGLTEEMLHGLERPGYFQLLAELGDTRKAPVARKP